MVCIGTLLTCLIGMYAVGTDETIATDSPSGKPQNRSRNFSLDQEIRQTIDAVREYQLLQTLELSEERSQHLVETLHDVRRIRQNYQSQRKAIEGKLELLLQVVQPDLNKIQHVLQELQTVKTAYYQQVLQADQALGSLLSAEEQAKYILFQRHFTQQLQMMIAKIRQKRSQTQNDSNFLLRRRDAESIIRQPH